MHREINLFVYMYMLPKVFKQVVLEYAMIQLLLLKMTTAIYF